MMFSHIMVGTNDLEKAKGFYDKVLGTLGIPPARVDGHRIFYMTPTEVFQYRNRSMTSLPPWRMAERLVSPAALHSKPTRGMPLVSRTAGRPSKTRRACAKAASASSISPICVIPTATSSVHCTGWAKSPWCRPHWTVAAMRRQCRGAVRVI